MKSELTTYGPLKECLETKSEVFVKRNWKKKIICEKSK
jgi:hypothetical protein